jgi:predicted transcriptional regulator
MVRQVDELRKREHRTRSELIREALRIYFARQFPVVKATAQELRALRRGRAEMAEGNYLTLDELFHALDSSRRTQRRKKTRAA